MTAVSASSLFWIALGALLVPLLSRRFNLPSAVGELIYGIVFGPYFLGMIYQDDFIDFMAQVGFAILMFSAGMEIDFGHLRRRGSRLLRTAVSWVTLTGFFVVGGALLLGVQPWPALAVCAVSVGLASVLLRERHLSAAPLGQAILAAGLIGETVTILALAIFDFHARLGVGPEFFLALGKFTGIFVLAYLLMRVFRFIIWWYPKRISPFLESGDPLELGVRLAVALMFIFVAAAAMLEVESILGAFIAGALFGFIFQEREVITEKINAMGQGFFVPFFFIVVGSHFDPFASVFAFSAIDFGKLLLLAVAVKVIPSLLFSNTGLSIREMVAGGLLLSAPLTLTIAVAEVGAKLEVITPEMQGLLILIAIVAGLGAPFLARVILPVKAAPARTREPSG